MTLNRYSNANVRRVMEQLKNNNDLRYKLQFPKHKSIVEEMIGKGEFELMAHLVWVISYVEGEYAGMSYDQIKDGNYNEIRIWIGLSHVDMALIKQAMMLVGWTPDLEVWSDK